jgi:TM2 domain-containing membrane protein YozV
MAQMIDYLPQLEGDEARYIRKLMQKMDDETAKRFANVYRVRRKDPQTIMLTAVLGIFLVAGIHRFILGQIGMGILYLLTGGLCLVGTIVDLINYKNMTFEYNRDVAREIVPRIK